MLILGINEGIESSAVLCRDGEVIFAVQEERLSRESGHIGFPYQSVSHCLKAYQLDARNIDHVCWSNLNSPLSEAPDDIMKYYACRARSWPELLLSGDVGAALVRFGGRLPASIGDVLAEWQFSRRKMRSNPSVERLLARCGLDGMKTHRFHHHSNHAASAYYGLRRNFADPHLVFTLDGGGDDACAHVYLARGGRLELLASTAAGHSLGNVYACTTFLMGMRPHEHEYKVMGLAPYADPGKAEGVRHKFQQYLDLDPSNPLRFKRRVRERTTMLLPRMVHDFRFTRFDDVAAGLQQFTEDLLVRWIGSAVKLTGVAHVLAAGGVFMNVKANKRIAELPGIRFFDVFPSCGDESLPFGAVWQCHVNEGGRHEDIRLNEMFLGPDAAEDLPEAKRRYGDVAEFEYIDDPERKTAQLLAAGHIVGRCSGRMEFGARALGNRSILADPRDPVVMSRINQAIKRRDFWMPFAPAVLGEKAEEYLMAPPSLPPDRLSPFMMHSFDTTERGKSLVSAVHPVDGTARAQLVWQTANPTFHALITHFGRLTGTWSVLNTSFNLHGHPIVCGTIDAVEVMLASGLEYVVVDHYLIRKRRPH
jgi:carbamoyltransferase